MLSIFKHEYKVTTLDALIIPVQIFKNKGSTNREIYPSILRKLDNEKYGLRS